MQRISSYLTLGLLFITTAVVALDTKNIEKSGIRADNIEFNVANGEWIFTGNVVVEQETFELRADEVTLHFQENDLVEAIAAGKPASFKQQPKSSAHMIEGYAQKIVIDNKKNVATFSGGAILRQNLHEIKGGIIVYDMQSERMSIRSASESDLSTQAKESSETNESLGIKPRPTLIIQQSNSLDNAEYVKPQALSSEQTPLPIIENKTSERRSNQHKEMNLSSVLEFTAARVIDAGAAVYNSAGRNSVLVGGLSGRMPVKILGTQNDWARVNIKSGISAWIYSKYVEEIDSKQGRVAGRGVRARSMPSINSSIISILKPDQQVTILSKNSEWTRVTLPESTNLWIPLTQLQMLESVTKQWEAEWLNEHSQ
ncbi:MAG: lipopolysaccharide transport periplasmic protein LptA [Acidiferrobacteraceae bacterium]|nr:lipopolysaccharide transport periplasmic protein LptA [Acidiferrobacteraceae bacterium]|tara:strand:+ start:7563 stop:8675 length:1113 start_codon:yes stop_codon:yes gene_type:complete